MTTPLDQTSVLGDLFQVQLGPTMPVPVVNGIPGAMVTIANQDLTNTITIGRRNNITLNTTAGVQIPALGSLTLDASKTIWGLAPANTLPVLVMPGGGQWAPSPAQVAASINALGLAKDTTVSGVTSAVNAPAYQPITLSNAGLLAKDASVTPLAKDATVTGVAKTTDINGVVTAVNAPTYGPVSLTNAGLLGKDSTLVGQNTAIPNNIAATGAPLLLLNTNKMNRAGQTLAAGANFTSTQNAITQPSYHVYFDAVDNVAGTQYRTVEINLIWSDSATGKTVQQDNFYILPAGTGGTPHSVVGDGPTKGDTLVVSITNHDSAAITYNFTISQDSKVFTRDLWRTLVAGAFPTGFTLGTADPGGNVLCDQNPNLGAGITAERWLPLWTGTCAGSFVPGSGASGNVTYQIWSTTPAPSNWSRPYTFTLAGGNVATQTSLVLPNAQCYLHIINNGTASAIMGTYLTGFEQ